MLYAEFGYNRQEFDGKLKYAFFLYVLRNVMTADIIDLCVVCEK